MAFRTCGIASSSSTFVQPRHSFAHPLGSRRPIRPRAMPAVAQAEEVKEEWWNKGTTPNMVQVNGVAEFVAALASAGEKLVVADIYANWCGACRGVYPKLCQLANEHPDIVVLKINFDDNKAIAKALNVRVLPYFVFYRGAEGQLDAFSASLSKVGRLREAIAVHNTPRCSLGPSPGIEGLPAPQFTTKYWQPDLDATPVNPCIGPGCEVDLSAENSAGTLAGAGRN